MATITSSSSREEVKVVLVDTQYVVTDATSFKSVVQNLTGKNSCVEWIDESGFTGEKRKRPISSCDGNGTGRARNNNDGISSGRGSAGGGVAVGENGDWRLSTDLPFKDLDRMLLELPPMEEWHRLWAENCLLSS